MFIIAFVGGTGAVVSFARLDEEHSKGEKYWELLGKRVESERVIEALREYANPDLLALMLLSFVKIQLRPNQYQNK